MYAEHFQIDLPVKSDDLFPMLAINHFPLFTGVVFLLGITAAAYSSADSALTSLTTSFCVDFLGKDGKSKKMKGNTRTKVHLGFSLLLFLVIILFRFINDDSVISAVFKVAGYTYGPLLGLYAYGLFTKWKVRDHLVPWICLGAPGLSYIIDLLSGGWFGFFILVINGLITFLGLLAIRVKQK
jgi:Na+/proline symporter